MMISRILDDNSIEYVVAVTYASAKGRLFEMFFGWRGCRGNYSRVVLSKKGWARVDEMVRYYHTFCEKKD